MTQQSHLERPAFTRDVNLASGGLGASWGVRECFGTLRSV